MLFTMPLAGFTRDIALTNQYKNFIQGAVALNHFVRQPLSQLADSLGMSKEQILTSHISCQTTP